MNKYRIQVEDLYNFNKTDFIINIITVSIIITRSDRYRKAKSVQPNNQKWIIIIKCINTSD